MIKKYVIGPLAKVAVCLFSVIIFIIWVIVSLVRYRRLKKYCFEPNQQIYANLQQLTMMIAKDKSNTLDERHYLLHITNVLNTNLGESSCETDSNYIKISNAIKQYQWDVRDNCTEEVYAAIKKAWLTPGSAERWCKQYKDFCQYQN